MTTGEDADAQISRGSRYRQLSIPSKLTILVLPLAIVTVLLAGLMAWGLTASGPDLHPAITIAAAASIALLALATVLMVRLSSKSVSRGISDVTDAANKVASEDLVDLLDRLSDPDPDLDSIEPLDLDVERTDEVGDLARSFQSLHGSLIEVGGRQMETLRRGVSSIFVTLARRNSSLIDRQIALLDELEEGEHDAKTLGSYYQLDHLATRMRRNSESLLVLAGSDSPRVWAKATELSDVIRAAVAEVGEYHRVEVLTLEPARLSGGAVSDMSHLLAELIENALQFSPPSEVVRVTGLVEPDGYRLTVTDRGVGISENRMRELNRILATPPTMGLTVEPTLGMYVVARLAHKHGVRIELSAEVPGLTASITLPTDHLEIPERPVLKYWEVDRGDSQRPRGPELSELTDAASRAYVIARTERARAAVVSAGDEVIDLTLPDMVSDADAEVMPLPRRNPGAAYAPQEESESTSPGEEAIEIRSALTAFDLG